MRLGLLTGVIGLAAGIVLIRLVSAQRVTWPPSPPLLWIPVGVVGAALVLGASWAGGAGFVAIWLVATAAFVSVGIVNHAHPGARLLTAGALANGLVVTTNAGMPVAASAIVAAGGSAGVLTGIGRHHLLTDASALPWLADTVGVGWLHLVLSPGDVLLAVGGVIVIATTLVGLVQRQRATTDPAPQTPDAPPAAVTSSSVFVVDPVTDPGTPGPDTAPNSDPIGSDPTR